MSELDWVTLGDRQIAWMGEREAEAYKKFPNALIQCRLNPDNNKIAEVLVNGVVFAAARMDEEWA